MTNVLLVDDDPSVTAGIGRRLKRLGWTIMEATSGPEALALIADQSVDVVVSDQQMPGMDGLVLLEKIAVSDPSTIRIMLTGHATMELAIQAINKGHVDRFLVKPCSVDELICGIKREQKFRAALTAVQDLLDTHHKQKDAMTALQVKFPDIMDVQRDERGSIVLDELPVNASDLINQYVKPAEG